MSPGRNEQSGAEREFFVALRDLHRRAGEPSSRTIASAIGNMSHTTVNGALRGNKVPSWPITTKLVESLGGDVEHFRQLWADTREPVVRHIEQPEVSVFVSYARIDNEATYSRVTRLINDVANTYRSLTGQVVGVFQDIDSIKPGDDWKDRIRLGLSSSSILLAFVSPAYLGSANCREELSEFFAFLDVNSSERLIIPLLYSDPDRIEARFAKDALWGKLSKLQRIDISRLRSVDPGSSEWIQRVEEIADRIDEILADVPAVTAEESRSDEAETAVTAEDETDSQGTFERLAAVEATMPATIESMNRVAFLLNQVGNEAQALTPAMLEADTFAKKLSVSNELADRLDPFADELVEEVDKIVNSFKGLNFFVNQVIILARENPSSLAEDPDAISALNGIWQLANTASTTLNQLDEFSQTLTQTMGFAKRLDRPLSQMRKAFLQMADIRGILKIWMDEMQVLQSTYPDFAIITDTP